MLRRALAPLLLLTVAFATVLFFLAPGAGSFSGQQIRWVGLAGLGSLFVFAAGGIFWSLWLFSSRVAGPLLQLQRTLEMMAAGDLTARMRVRKKDELQEHTDYLNRTVESLQNRVVRIKQFCDYTRRSIEEMQTRDPNNPNLSRMLDLVGSIEESVGDFRVKT